MHTSCLTKCYYRAERVSEREGDVGMGGEVKKAMGLEAEVEEGGEEGTWEKLLITAPVRVLLVEGDDSTRQIITALLLKCGYRVTVASDGLKAWEMLREKDHCIDLVLTEVELPKMSGVVLLTMMMDQESCNHIPVIMMSSNDSVSIAFKCMIKGAADFLVKPVRKNELKNLWQHVWRKQKDAMSLFPNHEPNGVQPEGKTDRQELDREDESSTELFDLIAVINDRPQHIYISESSRDNFTANLPVDIELERMPSSMPSLELSLDMSNSKENDGSNALHHSNSSPFSLYNNNSAAVLNLSVSSIEPPADPSAVNRPHHNGLIPEPDGTNFGTTFRCNPIRVIPFPVPAGDAGIDRAGSNPFLQSIFYQQSSSSPFFWGAMPSIFAENQPHQPTFHDMKPSQCHNQEDFSLKSHGFQAHHLQEEVEEEEAEEAELIDEQIHVSTVTGDSASACNPNENGHSAVSKENNGAVAAFNGDEDGKTANKCQLSQREAALNKFRLKRKERCFEKKVRYLSRKRLAEQRPRVKGQFVRQA